MPRILGLGAILSLAGSMAACRTLGVEDEQDSTESAVHDARVDLPTPIADAALRAANEGPIARERPLERAPVSGVPVFEPGGDSPAYYEVDLAPGWAIITADDAPRAVELGADGVGPATRLARHQKLDAHRVVRLDTAIYVAVDPVAGNAVGQSSPILRIDRAGARAMLVPVSADEAIADYPRAKNELLRSLAAAGEDPPDVMRALADERTCEVEGDVPSYEQIAPNEAPNDSSCHSGCGPTAWATIFGWASRRAAQSSNDRVFEGLFRDGDDAKGAIVVAPMQMDPVVAELSWTLREDIGTFCLSDQGATTTWDMESVSSFIASRAPGVKSNVTGNALSIASGGIRDAVIDALCDGRPSIIGTGSLFAGSAHYPIAKGYKPGYFLLEMGWGGSKNGWYEAKTWFMGNVSH